MKPTPSPMANEPKSETDEAIVNGNLVSPVGGRLSMLSASAKEFIPFGAEDDSGMSSRDDDGSRKTNVDQGGGFGAGVDATSNDGFEGDLGLYAQVQLEAELLEIMAESFSEFSPECLQVALAKSDWDLDRASEGLVSALQASDPERSSKPCRHLLLEGECFRRDCAFSHNFSLTPCRFWLYGRCMYSLEECAFRHDLDVPVQGTIHRIPEAEESEPDFNRDSPRGGQAGSNFPSLPLKPPANETGRANETDYANDGGNEKDVLLEAVLTTPGHKKGNHGRQGAKNRRKARFKAVNIQALMREDSSSIGNVERHDGGVGQGTWGPSVGPSFATVVRSTDKPVGAGQRRGGGEVRGVRNSNSGVVQGSKGTWVSTGDAVASQYEKARKEAAELARARNKLFTSATEAFRRGHGKAARDLARRGRELNAEMKERHRQAANAIFADRNPGDQIFERKTIDLHALHVREVLEVLPRELEALAERNVDRVRVLAGTGHHSKGPTSKARLIPAVETFCHTRGFSYRLVADNGTAHVGMVEIDLSGSLLSR